MSLVGTRPPLISETNLYELHHKARLWYVISSIMVKAISIITTPIFTRMLSTSEYGTVSTFTSWSGLLLTFFTLNLTYSIGRAKLDYPDKLDDYVGSMQLLHNQGG